MWLKSDNTLLSSFWFPAQLSTKVTFYYYMFSCYWLHAMNTNAGIIVSVQLPPFPHRTWLIIGAFSYFAQISWLRRFFGYKPRPVPNSQVCWVLSYLAILWNLIRVKRTVIFLSSDIWLEFEFGLNYNTVAHTFKAHSRSIKNVNTRLNFLTFLHRRKKKRRDKWRLGSSLSWTLLRFTLSSVISSFRHR